MNGHLISTPPLLDALIYKIDPAAKMPERKSKEAAGYDLCCLESFSIFPGELKFVRTGLVIQPPPGFHFELIVRSGLAAKHGIRLANGVGLVDRDYAGAGDEVKFLMYRDPKDQNTSPVEFAAGDRVAQLIFRQTILMNLREVEQAPSSVDRAGFGSTGVK